MNVLRLQSWIAAASVLVFSPAAIYAQDQPPAVAEGRSDDVAEPSGDVLANDRARKLAHIKEELGRITLPENPSREQCAAYIDTLRPLSQDAYELVNSKELTEMFAPKFNEFPAAFAHLLLAEYNGRGFWYCPGLKARLDALEADEQMLRPLVAANLENTPSLISTVVYHGWCEDVRDVVINTVLASEVGQGPDDDAGWHWFAAAVELDEPKLYKKLHDLTLAESEAEESWIRIKLLEALPDYDLNYTINALLKRAEDGQMDKRLGTMGYSSSIAKLCAASARRGDIDALGHLIGLMPPFTIRNKPWMTYASNRLAVIKLIEFRGSTMEIQAWFKENRDKLVFDAVTKRFVIRDNDS